MQLKVNTSMEQDPSGEHNSCSASKERTHLLWYVEVDYRVRESPLPIHFLNQMEIAVSRRGVEQRSMVFGLSWRE